MKLLYIIKKRQMSNFFFSFCRTSVMIKMLDTVPNFVRYCAIRFCVKGTDESSSRDSCLFRPDTAIEIIVFNGNVS